MLAREMVEVLIEGGNPAIETAAIMLSRQRPY